PISSRSLQRRARALQERKRTPQTRRCHCQPNQPLFACVMVNRIWQHHFGQGLVRTPSNFGHLGERPTHPELLDFLAATFIDQHWSNKAIHREIMVSATYQLSADEEAKNVAQDAAGFFEVSASESSCSPSSLPNSVPAGTRCVSRRTPA